MHHRICRELIDDTSIINRIFHLASPDLPCGTVGSALEQPRKIFSQCAVTH
jgi:hypothetical protein